MCLSRVTERLPANRKTVVAYKGFGHMTKAYAYHFARYGKVKRGIWLKAKNRDWSLGFRGHFYKAGFHGWEGANGPVRVLFRSVRTIGTQDRERVLVADWMYVPAADEMINEKGKIVKKPKRGKK